MSPTPLTVTVLTEFQFELVKCRVVLLSAVTPVTASITPSLSSEVAIVIVKLSDGALDRLTVKFAVFRFSSVSPEI